MEYRKNNFTILEKKCFTDILKKHAKVIENKQTDGATLRAKNCAWEKITEEFNASPYALNETTSKQLKRLWTNMKQRQRTMLAQERQHRLATGGGPAVNDALVDPDITAVAPALIVGIEDAIDSDHIPEIIITDSQTSSYDPLPPPTSPILPPPTSPILPPPTPVPRPPVHSHSPPPGQLGSQRQRQTILAKEFANRKRRFDEIHNMEMLVWKEKLREAKAKADLAELALRQQS